MACTALRHFQEGPKATAFNPRAVAAMERCGLKIVADDRLRPIHATGLLTTILPLHRFASRRPTAILRIRAPDTVP